MPARERLIVALDVPEAAAARSLVQQIGDAAGIYKVGLQLFTAEGPGVVRKLADSGHRVFLDLKLHDIPNTVASAVRAAGRLNASMLTLHASGGINMLRAARDAAPPGLKLLAVTVLTSLSDEDLQEIGIAGRVTDQVLRAAALARQAGCDGVVASARESALLRRELGEGFIIVNPGVRPAGAETNDQQRVATPAEAIAAGASHIVVGRPVTQSADPAGAARAIIAEMEQAQVLR
ncbi:MAG TPA: orotidine-5'-phosphate decarboxylase [Terriglobales bacterium]|nr:orotidine-5'-phosphate decarboxylase [Terriglobales bacterium]